MSDSTPASTTPRDEYQGRHRRRCLELEGWRRVEKRISLARLLTMVILVTVAWLSLQSRLLAIGWAALPLLGFIALVVAHRRVLALAQLADNAVQFYDDGLARLEDRWQGRGKSGDSYRDGDHLYSPDLDIFGHGSLFELLATTCTRAGDDCLAGWLLEAADIDTLRLRHAAVAELRQRLDFREELSRVGTALRNSMDPDLLIAWSTAIPEKRSAAFLRPSLLVLAGAQVAAAMLWSIELASDDRFTDLGGAPLFALLLVHAVMRLLTRERVQRSIHGAESAGRDLQALQRLLSRIEAESFHCERLRELRRQLHTEGAPPSRQIERLRKLVELLDSRKNPIFAPVAILLVWTPLVALAIDRWRARCGPHVCRWIAVAGEVEALAALSGYAFENPGDPFPELDERPTPLFVGEQLGHPLLSRSACVRNDIDLGDTQRLLLISGSNMSGKSTYLRTVGVNAVLALAGAPVRATRLRISHLRIGASIEIHDSLQEGQSRFYREILRVRDILELARREPRTLFLLDEILHGTNSHDRRIGAEAIVTSLLRLGAIGLVTTHDLALARITTQAEVAGTNVHFEDEIVDGEMVFDYRLRQGVVEKSNAIALMREVGLEV